MFNLLFIVVRNFKAYLLSRKNPFLESLHFLQKNISVEQLNIYIDMSSHCIFKPNALSVSSAVILLLFSCNCHFYHIGIWAQSVKIEGRIRSCCCCRCAVGWAACQLNWEHLRKWGLRWWSRRPTSSLRLLINHSAELGHYAALDLLPFVILAVDECISF